MSIIKVIATCIVIAIVVAITVYTITLGGYVHMDPIICMTMIVTGLIMACVYACMLVVFNLPKRHPIRKAQTKTVSMYDQLIKDISDAIYLEADVFSLIGNKMHEQD